MRKIYRVYSSSGDEMYVKTSCPEEALEIFLETQIERYLEAQEFYEDEDEEIVEKIVEQLYEDIYLVEGETSSYIFYYLGGWTRIELDADADIEILPSNF